MPMKACTWSVASQARCPLQFVHTLYLNLDPWSWLPAGGPLMPSEMPMATAQAGRCDEI